MWPELEQTFLLLMYCKRNRIDTFLFSWHMDSPRMCLAFNYSAGAYCIWTMCFVRFVLNLGSVLLTISESL